MVSCMKKKNGRSLGRGPNDRPLALRGKSDRRGKASGARASGVLKRLRAEFPVKDFNSCGVKRWKNTRGTRGLLEEKRVDRHMTTREDINNGPFFTQEANAKRGVSKELLKSQGCPTDVEACQKGEPENNSDGVQQVPEALRKKDEEVGSLRVPGAARKNRPNGRLTSYFVAHP